MKQIKGNFRNELGKITDSEWRQLFWELNLEIHARDNDNADTWPDRYGQEYEQRFSIAAANHGDIEVTFGLPLKAEYIKDIVFTGAGSNSTGNTMY